jgi:hypothetical protein
MDCKYRPGLFLSHLLTCGVGCASHKPAPEPNPFFAIEAAQVHFHHAPPPNAKVPVNSRFHFWSNIYYCPE